MQVTAGDAGTSLKVMYSSGAPHMAGQKQDDQHEHTSSKYMRIQGVALKTWRRRCTIGISGERGSGISVPAARPDDDDIYIYIYIPKKYFFPWALYQYNVVLPSLFIQN